MLRCLFDGGGGALDGQEAFLGPCAVLRATIDCSSIVEEATSVLDTPYTDMILQSSVDHCDHIVAGQSIM